MRLKAFLGWLTATTSLLVGCPEKKPRVFSPLEPVMVTVQAIDAETGKPIAPSARQARRAYYLDVTAAVPAFAQVFAHNSGGGLTPISDVAALAPGAATRILRNGKPQGYEPYARGAPVAPGGPLYVMAVSSKVALQELAAGSKDAEAYTRANDLVRKHGLKVEQEL